MKGLVAFALIGGVVLLAVLGLGLAEPVENLAAAGSGQMAIVLPSEQIAADCGAASSVADGACNVEVQEYDAFTMLLLWGGIALIVVIVAALLMVFFLALAFPN